MRTHTAVAAALIACATIVGAGACSASSTPEAEAGSTPSPSGQLSASDKAFLDSAAQAARFEVEGGKMAQQQAASQQLRQFGARMVHDHGQEYQQLQSLGQQFGVTVPADPDRQQQEMLNAWSSLRGGPFDCAYAPTQYMAHEAVIGAFEQEARNGQDPAVRGFAGQDLPMLHEHLDLASQSLANLNCSAPG